jgi:hypothetical protein
VKKRTTEAPSLAEQLGLAIDPEAEAECFARAQAICAPIVRWTFVAASVATAAISAVRHVQRRRAMRR